MGEIIWQRDGRAGLRFGSAVSVIDWLPHGRAITAQQRIDEVVHETKAAGNGVLSRSLVNRFASQSTKLDAVDLKRLGLAIQSLAEGLAVDPAVVERHGSKLQALDTSAQLFRRLATERRP